MEEGASGYHSADITKLVWSWCNYDKTTQTQGIPNYGIKLRTRNADTVSSRYHRIWSATSNVYKPYIEMTYTNYTDYTMGYAPYKYNNFLTVDNFQARMNCYSYALQMYFKGNFSSGTSNYKLHPGEFGLTLNDSLYEDNIDNWETLYTGYLNQGSASKMYAFVKQQMQRDAVALGISMNEIQMEQDFTLPSDYDENSQRIIALVANKNDFHFFVRHGNGTCNDLEHGVNCSIWSHKPGTSGISTVVETYYSYGEPLCDNSIYELATEYYGNSTPVFFATNQNSNLYDSYYYNGHSNSSTGTSFIQ